MSMTDLTFFRDENIEAVFVNRMDLFWPAHNHPGVFQIILVFEGHLELQFDEEQTVLGPDDYLVITPQRVHAERAVEPIKVLALSVNQSAIHESSTKALETMDEIIEALHKNDLIEVRHINTLSRAASQIITLYNSEIDESSEFVAKARELLEKRPEKEISIDEMAEVVRVCRGHLSRAFKKQVGLTPHQYHIQNRVRKATLLLIETEMTVMEISKACGFYDKSHFKRNFKRQIGLSPSEYRTAFKQAKRLIL